MQDKLHVLSYVIDKDRLHKSKSKVYVTLVSGDYNSDEDIECLDCVHMVALETSMPDEQDGADSGPEEGAIVSTIA
uniref:Uncharacterized protein n=1 Tax=Trichogramma kaykai TaxID=54128 RepID=A0ABD2XSC3_9HYME